MMNFVDAAGRTSLSLGASFLLGGLIGIERQYRQRTAGLRTNVLVAVGACQFINSAIMIAGAEGGARVLSYVVSGIGFLGAGAIMKEGANVTGLNTAATLWCSAAVGACCGASQEMQALLLTIFVCDTKHEAQSCRAQCMLIASLFGHAGRSA
jgi:putative Mg2+ transporter-C (MgtC) family protein